MLIYNRFLLLGRNTINQLTLGTGRPRSVDFTIQSTNCVQFRIGQKDLNRKFNLNELNSRLFLMNDESENRLLRKAGNGPRIIQTGLYCKRLDLSRYASEHLH